MKNWVKRLAWISAISAISIVGTSAPALASDDDDDLGSEIVVDRVIYKLDQNAFDESTLALLESGGESGVDLGDAHAIPEDEQPQVGEVVLVEYADATVVHQAVTLACTVTTTAGNPYKSGNYAHANTRFEQTGCTGIIRAESRLQMYWGFSWVSKSILGTNNPLSGNSYGFGHSWYCTNTNSSPFRSIVADQYQNSGMYIINTSNTVNLACGA
jgi:hypothetical protein